MADYIKREDALVLVQPDVMADEKAAITIATAKSLIRNLLARVPSADVEPVRHGRWETRPTGMVTDTGPEYKAYCTVCNEPNKQYQPPFCPHCGGKMDGGMKSERD